MEVKKIVILTILLHQAIINHSVVREIPVEFIDRTRGTTKIGIDDIFEFIINSWWIRFESSKTFIRCLLSIICG